MNLELLNQRLTYLQLPFTRDNYAAFAQEAAAKHGDHIQFLDSLVQGESDQRRQRVIQRRIKEARFPVLKTLEQFRWDWPKKINRLAVQNPPGHRPGLRRLPGRPLGALCQCDQRYQRTLSRPQTRRPESAVQKISRSNGLDFG